MICCFDLRSNLLCFLAPLSPRFIAEQCFCHDEPSGTSSGMLAWSVRDVGTIQGFILELDNGSVASDFRVREGERERLAGLSDVSTQEVYDGHETMCAVDGLLPVNVYTARVKAYNQAGESAYSECITLHSSAGKSTKTNDDRSAHVFPLAH